MSLLLGTIAREVPLSGGSAEVDNGSLVDAEVHQFVIIIVVACKAYLPRDQFLLVNLG